QFVLASARSSTSQSHGLVPLHPRNAVAGISSQEPDMPYRKSREVTNTSTRTATNPEHHCIAQRQSSYPQAKSQKAAEGVSLDGRSRRARSTQLPLPKKSRSLSFSRRPSLPS